MSLSPPEARVVDLDEAASVRGGDIHINIHNLGSETTRIYSKYDNMLIEASMNQTPFESHRGFRTVRQFLDGELQSSRDVWFEGEFFDTLVGEYAHRTSTLPFDDHAFHTLSLSTVEDTAVGETRRTQIRLSSHVRIASVRFWNMEGRQGGETENVNSAEAREWADSVTNLRYVPESGQSFDSLMGQRGTSDDFKKIWQFTYGGYGRIRIDSRCLNMQFRHHESPEYLEEDEFAQGIGCKEQIEEALEDKGAISNENSFDVVFYESMEGNGGANITGLSPGTNRNWVLVRDDLETAITLAHEFGHHKGIGHVNEEGSTHPERSECDSNERTDRKLMCSSAGHEVSEETFEEFEEGGERNRGVPDLRELEDASSI